MSETCPLRAYTQAVRLSSWATYGANGPCTGYAVLATSDWPTLYPAALSDSSQPKSPIPTNYSPHLGLKALYWVATTWMPFDQAPTSAYLELSRQERRVLNLPLLQCPVRAGAHVGATVLTVRRCFMTRPATPDSLVAEFAALLPESALSGRIDLFP